MAARGYTAIVRSWTRRAAGLLAVMVMTATPMVLSACAALCAPDVRHACHESAATLDGTAPALVSTVSAGGRSSTKTPVADTRHSCCAHAQAAVSPVSPALPSDADHALALLPVAAARVRAERAVESLTASPPPVVPPYPFKSPLILRL